MRMFWELAQKLGRTVPELLDQIRAHAIAAYASKETLALCGRHGVYVPQITRHDPEIVEHARAWWGDHKYHLTHKLDGDKHFVEFLELFPRFREVEGLQQYLESEYDLSILPAYMACGMEEAVKYVLPQMGFHGKQDPYGIKSKDAAITIPVGDMHAYVATRKSNYGTYLLTLTVPWGEDPTKGTFLCPMGCRRCYRSETRNRKNLVITETSEALVSTKLQQQTKALVELWEPEVSDVLVSGGEPLLFSNKIWRNDIVGVLVKSPHLKSLRVCTGVGMGLTSRLDDQFLDMLEGVRAEYGVQVGLNMHLSHPHHFTPELVDAALRIRRRGIRIMPQIPVVEGINFFNRDRSRSVAVLRKIVELSWYLLGEPVYKFIMDMQGSVSLQRYIEVGGYLFDRHQDVSNTVRPTSYEVFVDALVGNVNLSWHTLFALQKKIDREQNVVSYTIPHPAGGVVHWHEPLMEGINDVDIIV